MNTLADRMKEYERLETREVFDPSMSVCVRLDGLRFSKWTKSLTKPFDLRLSMVMQETTKELLKTYHANIGYTQSDEITLIFCGAIETHKGKSQNLLSRITSTATRVFNDLLRDFIPGKESAEFDARMWQVPTLEEAANVLLWRELDAIKNSISMAASSVYSHKQLLGKSGPEKIALLLEKGIVFEYYPTEVQRGSYISRRQKDIEFSVKELNQLPFKHEARTNPKLKVTRYVVEKLKMPPFKEVANKVGVLLGEDPSLK